MQKKELIKQLKPLDLIPAMVMIGLDNPNRANALTTIIPISEGCSTYDITIDTCFTGDTGLWETGIERNKEDWVIVEQYHNKTEATTGHNNWVKLLTNNPKEELHDIDQFGIEV
jgi:hypothetical protein